MKKNITFLIPTMDGGGAEKVVMLLANEMIERGWVVTLLMNKLSGPFAKKLNKNINIVILQNENISLNIFEISRYLKQKKPNIFYSSMMYVNVIAGLASIIAKYKGKLFFSEHQHISTSLKVLSSTKMKVSFFLAKFLYKRAEAIVCVSEGVENDLKINIKNLKRTLVIHNPIENYRRNAIKKDNSKFQIISIGRLHEQKNFPMLIRAFSEVLKEQKFKEKLSLYILGEGEERSSLEFLIKDLSLEDSVFLPGFVDKPEEILECSDLFVLSSKWEGFGNVIVEALSCGLPVISTDCPSGPAEILKGGEIGRLIPVSDEVSLKNAIIDEIENPDSISSKYDRYKRAEDFSVKNVTTLYEKLFTE